MPLCVAAGGLVMMLAMESFTLAWTHSIEKIRWEEDYTIDSGRLVLTEARVRGSGAGMEPPADASFANGVWHYDPHLAPLPVLRLTHSRYAAGYEVCQASRCSLLTEFAPRAGDGDVLELYPCQSAAAPLDLSRDESTSILGDQWRRRPSKEAERKDGNGRGP